MLNRLSYNDGIMPGNRDKPASRDHVGGLFSIHCNFHRGKRGKQGGRVMDRQEFYQDGVTRVTDPFYICICEKGCAAYSPIYLKKCELCGAPLRQCVPANKYNQSKGDQVN